MAGLRISIHRKRKKKTITSTNVLFDGTHLLSPGKRLGFIPEQKRWTRGRLRKKIVFFAAKSLKKYMTFITRLNCKILTYFMPEMQLNFGVFIAGYTFLRLFLVTMVKGRVVATNSGGGPTAPFRYNRDYLNTYLLFTISHSHHFFRSRQLSGQFCYW